MPHARARRRPVQQSLPRTAGWGGKRAGAGRKPGPRPRTRHRARPPHAERHPVHLTLRARREAGSLRAPRAHLALVAALTAAQRDSFRVTQYSVQADHVHLIAEATDGAALTAGVQGLVVRAARAINRATGNRGAVWGDRYHRRDLTTPREVHHALVYVLCNARKHAAGVPRFDGCSSAPWFDGWRDAPPAAPPDLRRPVRAARSWLLTTGWRRHGLLAPATTPGERDSWRRVAARQGSVIVTIG